MTALYPFLLLVFVVLPIWWIGVLVYRMARESRIDVSPRTEGEAGERLGKLEGDRRRTRLALLRRYERRQLRRVK